MAGQRRPARTPAQRGTGYAYLHHAVDDHSRLAYTEILADETQGDRRGVLATRPARSSPPTASPCERVLTDNGSCYRSRLWAKTLAASRIKHKRTRPYRPQTNGKVERFNRTLLEEWAYARAYRSEAERAAAFPGWLHTYNHHRGHTALKGKSPIDRVPNLPGQNS